MPALPENFPVRNRIIAALGCACLVIQAALRSGSLSTARQATELGRDVWAVPGRIFDRRAHGTNELIRDGASPALDPDHLLESLPLAVKEELDRGARGARSARRGGGGRRRRRRSAVGEHATRLHRRAAPTAHDRRSDHRRRAGAALGSDRRSRARGPARPRDRRTRGARRGLALRQESLGWAPIIHECSRAAGVDVGCPSHHRRRARGVRVRLAAREPRRCGRPVGDAAAHHDARARHRSPRRAGLLELAAQRRSSASRRSAQARDGNARLARRAHRPRGSGAGGERARGRSRAIRRRHQRGDRVASRGSRCGARKSSIFPRAWS